MSKRFQDLADLAYAKDCNLWATAAIKIRTELAAALRRQGYPVHPWRRSNLNGDPPKVGDFDISFTEPIHDAYISVRIVPGFHPSIYYKSRRWNQKSRVIINTLRFKEIVHRANGKRKGLLFINK